jgi:hypothetical protein
MAAAAKPGGRRKKKVPDSFFISAFSDLSASSALSA